MGSLLSMFSTRRARLDSPKSTKINTAGRGEISRRSSSSSSSSSSSFSPPNMSSKGVVVENPVQKKPSSSSSYSTASIAGNNNGLFKKKNYGFIPDNFSTLDQVIAALRESGLESSNLIIGIDFTKSNEWTGKVSFNNRSLHAIGNTLNPYEKAISIIGKTLAPFDEDNLIPCFGFGDATTHDQEVFSFHSDHSPCHGFEEVLDCYKKVVSNLQLSGPTSYGPVVDAAIDIVERSGGQYHILVIIADGQVTRSVNTNDRELSPQEEKTIKSIVTASLYPLSIVLIGVGDGPWEDMRKFDDKIPAREFDNFQFVNFTAIMSKDVTPSEKETAFAVAALMEIPIQYKAATEFGLVGCITGKAKKIVPRPPPVPYTRRAVYEPPPVPYTSPAVYPPRELSNPSNSTTDEQNQATANVCVICLTNVKDMAFGCGHMTCRECGSRVSNCPICRQRISSRLRVYTG